MFDIGFFELCLLFIVALIVLGPHRLPRVAREAGLWFGHIQRWVSSIKREINRELDQHDFDVESNIAIGKKPVEPENLKQTSGELSERSS